MSQAASSQKPHEESIPSFRYAMEDQEGRVSAAGSAKEANVDEFPISEGIAAVSMRLEPGSIRELHWHAIAAEWAYMLSGHCRVTVYSGDGTGEVADFGPGDVWYFPRGYPHSIQALSDGCHFLLIFDDGHFSEFGTFSLTDWVGHTPAEVLAKNFGVPEATFARFPREEVYIVPGTPPGPLPIDPPRGSLRSGPLTHKFSLEAQAPRRFAGGEMRIVSSAEFPISTTMTGATMTIKPGAIRALHWHPHAAEWQYVVAGSARVTVFASHGHARTEELGVGDIAYIPQGFGHYIENSSQEDLQLVIAFNSGRYESIELADWLASNPSDLVAANFGVPQEVVDRLSLDGGAIR
ncbi:MAG: cupin domain-containing protein [Pirellulales bacterium]|nr:cupin domain-containing protein [Pirellulales bacterium]